MYRVGLVCTNGNKFMNAKTFSDEKSARAFKKTCEKTFEGEAEFVISAFATVAEKSKRHYTSVDFAKIVLKTCKNKALAMVAKTILIVQIVG